jgi:hypothetical protein
MKAGLNYYHILSGDQVCSETLGSIGLFRPQEAGLLGVDALGDVPRAWSLRAKPQIEDGMIALQTVTAVIEAGAGLALLALPSVTAALLLGTPLDSSAAESLARIGGAAIVALAIVCWQTRRDVHGATSQGLVLAMLFYNTSVTGVLATANFGHDLHGILLWPAVFFHSAMAAWCVAALFRREEGMLG